MYDPRVGVCRKYKTVVDTRYCIRMSKVNSQISVSIYHSLGECRWSENNRIAIADWQHRKQCSVK